MKISIINAGYFKLDGGSMFGIVPKTIWNKLNPSDENNRCAWTMRCLLVETEDRKILIDTGMGTKQNEKFRSHFEPHGPYELVSSLAEKGLKPQDITDVFLTHLHFDHAGGALVKEGNDIVPQFPNAKYWTNHSHLEWALKPNLREKASFLRENIIGLQEAGVLSFIEERQDIEWIKGITIKFFYGHTEAMMVPIIEMDNGKLFAYCADIMPSSYHIRLPYVMSYDIRPIVTIKEKKEFLEYCMEHNIYHIFEHDIQHECGKVAKDNKERYYFCELKSLSAAL